MSEGTPSRTDPPATRPQALLLQAALSEDDAARRAWTQWRAQVDLDHLDYGSQRLIPLLYSALRRRDVSDPQMARFKGVYRRAWYDNTLRFHAAGAMLRALRGAGIETMLLDGAALALQYYGDLGLRPMDAVDILVPAHRRAEAVALLETAGWAAVEPDEAADAETPVVRLRNARGHEVHLHRHVFDRQLTPVADGEFWAAAHPGAVAGAPTQFLGASGQLLRVCERGMRRTRWDAEDARDPGWIADAVMVLRNPPEPVDWRHLSAQARKLRLVLPVREALGYLRDLLDVPVPADALAQIRAMPVSVAERIAERARTRPTQTLGPWAALGVRYLEYASHLPPGAGVVRRLAGLPAFFQRRWGSASLWHLPAAAAFRVLRRVRWAAEGQRIRRAGLPAHHTRP